MNKVRVLVLGDLGRSPRMKNHCLSFADNGWDVYFSGYNSSDLPIDLKNNSNIHINEIYEPSECIKNNKQYKVILLLKVILTSIYLFFHLLLNEWTHVIMIQNPPAVPTFLVVYMICKLRRIKVLVDWHNFGYTLIPGADDKSNKLKRLYKRIEIRFSKKRLKPLNFCVSKAMKNELLLKWKIDASVLYDLPLKIDGNRDLQRIHDLYNKLCNNYSVLKDDINGENIITCVNETGECGYKQDRPAILVSSCSWTIDDDFDTLFDALNCYNERKMINQDETMPKILCIITGKGPRKAEYENRITDKKWENVSVIMPWLQIEDYPTMLSSADLGVSLHNSTSGLDLPMKIVDMFSVCLPVLALNYKCLHELVKDRRNGRLFQSHEALSKHLQELLTKGNDELNKYREYLIGLKDKNEKNKCDFVKNDGNVDDDDEHDEINQNIVPETWKEHWDDVVLTVATDLAIEADKKFNKIIKYE